MLKYLKGTRGLKSTLSVDNLHIINWLVDASYATHEECKSHMGSMVSLGKELLLVPSVNKRLKARALHERSGL